MSTPLVDNTAGAQAALVAAAVAGDEEAFTALVAPHARELQLHCYRMLGSLHEAEDLLQETLLRAWRRLDTFGHRAPVRAWLYRIATNACLDALARRGPRLVPQALGPARDGREPAADAPLEVSWLEPYPDTLIDPGEDAAPEARAVRRETVELAFLAAIQLLPPRQRAVLLLREVLGWRSAEVASLLDTTEAAVNSALRRARRTLSQADLPSAQPSDPDTAERQLLARYIRAWETADVDGLVALLADEATFTMPPSPTWYRGREAIAAFVGRWVFAQRGALRLIPTGANGRPAFGLYERKGGRFVPLALQVLTVVEERVAVISGFVLPELFPSFGLPAELRPGQGRED